MAGTTRLIRTACASSAGRVCYGGNSVAADTCVTPCISCAAGSTLTQVTGTSSDGGCSFTYDNCVPNTTTCKAVANSCITGNAAAISNCTTSTTTCFGGQPVRTCTECETGYNLTVDELTVSGCSNTYSRNICKKNATLCLPRLCKNDTTWVSAGTGVDSRTDRSCIDNIVDGGSTCTEITVKRCAAGYYGNGITCTACPDGGTTTPVTEKSGTGILAQYTNKITDCYITTGADSTGSFEYDPQCNYTK